jgi:hypothetical protein
MRDMLPAPVDAGRRYGPLGRGYSSATMRRSRPGLIWINSALGPSPMWQRRCLGTHHTGAQLRIGGGIPTGTKPTLAWIVQFAMGYERWLY